MANEQPQHIDPLWQDFEHTQAASNSAGGEAAQPESNKEAVATTSANQPELTQAELDELFKDRTYVGRFDIDTDLALADSLNTWGALCEKYGRKNVLSSGVSVDPDTQRRVHTPGKIGLWVDTAAKQAVDENSQQA